MLNSPLVRIFGFSATLIHGDTLVLDRWLWLKTRISQNAQGEKLLDVGCGSGAFTIGAALRDYDSLGLSWDERNQKVAQERALLCQTTNAHFEVLDVRRLDTRRDLASAYDVVLSFENIEHILDDSKLMQDIANCLKPGGRLLLTTPYYHYRAITPGDNGPFSTTEDGGHVRRGYTRERLLELCEEVNLVCDSISFCSGFLSQKITYLLRTLSSISPLLAWALTLPLRPLPLLMDPMFTKLTHWPFFSICLEAHKPSQQRIRSNT